MMYQDTKDQKHWQAIKEEEIYAALETSDKGLKKEDIKERIDFYGENKLPESKKITLLKIILHQLLNPLIFILVAHGLNCFWTLVLLKHIYQNGRNPRTRPDPFAHGMHAEFSRF